MNSHILANIHLSILGIQIQFPTHANQGYATKDSCTFVKGIVALIVCSQGYWANHLDFGIANARSSALLGRSKAAEITVNILLPFACAWGEFSAEPELKEKAISLYLSYPKQEDNQLTRFMKQQLLLSPGCKLSAAQQQGLIHIFKTYCKYRNCSECPIVLSQG